MKQYPHCVTLEYVTSGPYGSALFFGTLPVSPPLPALAPFFLHQAQQAQKPRRFIVLDSREAFFGRRIRKRPITHCTRGAVVPRKRHPGGARDPRP